MKNLRIKEKFVAMISEPRDVFRILAEVLNPTEIIEYIHASHTCNSTGISYNSVWGVVREESWSAGTYLGDTLFYSGVWWSNFPIWNLVSFIHETLGRLKASGV